MKCQFCNKNEGTESITDSETQQEILICSECDNNLNWDLCEEKIKDGYSDLTIQEAQKFDEMIDNEIDYLKEKKYE